MTAEPLLSLAAGDRQYNPAQRPILSRTDPVRQSPAAPFAWPDVGMMGRPSPPTVPSARRLRERTAIPAASAIPDGRLVPGPSASLAAAAAMSPIAPISAVSTVSPVTPVTHAPAEPAPNVETHLTPDEPSDVTSYIPLPGCPHPLFAVIKRWAPTFVPSLAGALALAVALTLLFRGVPVGANLASFGGIPGLLAIYGVGGALFGLALYLAANDTVWFASLVLGSLLLPAAVFLPLLGPVFGGGLVALALVLAVFTLRARYEPVADGTVTVTKLFGRYFRLIRPSKYLRLPFERPVATLDTHEQIFTSPTQYTELRSPQGVPYRARATCTAIYAVLSGEAHRVVPVLDTWERDLQQLLIVTLSEALRDWATQIMVTSVAPPHGTLARTVLGEARAWAHLRGIWIMRVRVHNIWLEPAASSWATHAPYVNAVPAAALGRDGGGGALQSKRTGAIRPTAAPDARRSASPLSQSQSSQPYQPGSSAERVTPASASPEVLAAAYEAVREGRVTDPVTIRGIAQAFARVAEHPAADVVFPYDTAAAARMLWEYADKLEQHLALSDPAPRPAVRMR